LPKGIFANQPRFKALTEHEIVRKFTAIRVRWDVVLGFFWSFLSFFGFIRSRHKQSQEMAIFGRTICSITVNNLTALNPKTVKITIFYLDLTAKFSGVSGLLVLGIDGFRNLLTM
jgi:hypothetical protein